MAAYFSRTYRIRRWLVRYWRWSDLFAFLLTVLAGYLAWLSYSQNPTATTFATAIYVLAAIGRSVIVIRTRRARDYVQASIFWNLCDQICRNVFAGEKRIRVTLFERDRLRWGFIVPKYRYEPGASDPIEEADRSRARYKKGQGITGRAWSEPGRIFLANFPSFATRDDFVNFYVNRVGIDREVVNDLSPYMQACQGMLAYGLDDSIHRFLGVVSMDFIDPIQTSNVPAPTAPSQHQVPLDGQRIHDVLQSMQTVLAAFQTRPGSAS